jgi:redox-sensitive bicupin YhaK (pirin superfamily)
MYHGDRVPGFPRHPHRGFETITIVEAGWVDHSDSLGARARFGAGDVQWVTAGAGIEHAEMFPLLDAHSDNPLELLQIWLNLPRASKRAAPHFTMYWHEDIPVAAPAPGVRVRVIAGTCGKVCAPVPPPESYAAQPNSAVNVWAVDLEPGAAWHPDHAAGTCHGYVTAGRVHVAGVDVPAGFGVELERGDEVHCADASRIYVLGGEPLREPVASWGPFVMNDDDELREAYEDLRAGKFGRWPFPVDDPVHGGVPERFADAPLPSTGR